MRVQGRYRQDDGRWDSGEPGDFWFAQGTPGNIVAMIYRCPHCGRVQSLDLSEGAAYRDGERHYWWWNRNRDAPTLLPSIHTHDPPPGGGQGIPIAQWPTHWHGFLTDGVFT